jgi:fructosamine-3-kinase
VALGREQSPSSSGPSDSDAARVVDRVRWFRHERSPVNDETLRRTVTSLVDDRVTAIRRLDGGMVGTVRRVDFDGRPSLVAKTGETPLDVEARMLRYLGRYTSLPVPAVEYADRDLLVLEHVTGDTTHDRAVEHDAAARLAALHDHTAGGFGFPFDTLTGPLDQPNRWTTSWIEFFGEQRLGYLTAVARDAGSISAETAARLERVVADLDVLLAEPRRPALLHGDVWTENVLARDGQVRAFLDPACYYGHPEAELAYVAWTDTFGEVFFERYRQLRGIASGFAERQQVYRLTALVIHVHLFGEAYAGDLDRTLATLGY